jgi:hypothetical protein
MTRSPSPFKQQVLVRALKGAKAAGIEVARIEIDKDGKIVISTPRAPAAPNNPYDAWRAKQDAS